MLNLLANAVRHNHPGGTAELRTGSADGAALLTVTNSGPVLDPEEVRRSSHRSTGAVPAPRARAARGSAWRWSRRSPPRTAARSPPPRAPGGGLTVRVRLPS
ncbi:hypothetical protein GCM10020229_55760 [Kitasatospora albolonga]